MSLQFVDTHRPADHLGSAAPVPPFTLSIATTELSRWWDPSAQHVTWRLRLTNAGDVSVPGLVANFGYAAHCGASTAALSLTSRSSRANVAHTWGVGRSLTKAYPVRLAAWETLLLTGVFSSTSNAGGTVSVSFGIKGHHLDLGRLSAEF